MDISKVLKDLRTQKGLTRQQLSTTLDLKERTYLKYETGEARPPYETLIKLADFYNVSTDYLLGRAAPPPVTLEKLLEERNDFSPMEKRFLIVYYNLDRKMRNEFVRRLEEAAEQERIKAGDPLPEKKIIEIPCNPNRVSAGGGEWLEDLEDFPLRVVSDICSEGCSFAVQIDGDSMTPDYPDGCYVLVRVVDSMCPSDGTVGIFILNGSGYLKVFREDPVRLHSINPEYDDIIIGEDDEFRYVGVVLGIAELEDDEEAEENKG